MGVTLLPTSAADVAKGGHSRLCETLRGPPDPLTAIAELGRVECGS